MTTATERLTAVWEEPRTLRSWVTTVDHKRIGVRYLVTAAAFFLAAGIEALVMRAQLALPASDVVGPGTYDQLFTMHGVTMIFLFVTPMLFGFGNYLVPLMLGARDMAFPRLNAFSYWVFLLAGCFIYSGFLAGTGPTAGWFNYPPLSLAEASPGRGIDFYGLGLIFMGISTTAGAVNFIVSILRLRAPGMSLNRIPLYCWSILATSSAVILAIPALTAANIMLELERLHGFHFFSPDAGGEPLLWQHVFWTFGHPDVYIIFLPAVGIVSAIVPVFARRPIIGYAWIVVATMATATLGFGVWVHHMFATGLPQVSLTFFSAASLVIAIPSAVQVFAWLATLWHGRPQVRTPLLYVLGFLATFVVGGVTGVMFAVVPFDQQVTDSYFVVAHFHYVLFGGAVFPILAGVHHWLPKMAGRMFHEGLGVASFWLVFVGFNLAFLPMHISGLLGMPRRVYTYPVAAGWDAYNLASTIGAFILAAGLVLVAGNVAVSLRWGREAGPDPWGGDTLEWTVSSPPPAYDFAVIPRVGSLHPAWDRDDREEDARRAARGDGVLAEGHQTIATDPLDARSATPIRMPGDSPWPAALALTLAVVMVGLLLDVVVLTTVAGVLSVVCLAFWHRPNPELQQP